LAEVPLYAKIVSSLAVLKSAAVQKTQLEAYSSQPSVPQQVAPSQHYYPVKTV